MESVTTPCREASSLQSRGYGQKYGSGPRPGVPVLMHRWVIAQIEGWDAIRGRVVMHKCDNPACFRYDHLQIGRQVENLRDAVAKKRGRFAHTNVNPRRRTYPDA